MYARFLSFLLLAATAVAAPMTLKELEFLLRQETPEADILKEARARRLVAPITPAVADALKLSGATEGLLRDLNAADVVLSPEESRAEHERQMTAAQSARRAAEEDRLAVAARAQRDATVAAARGRAETVRRALSGNLLRLDGDQLRPADSDELTKDVRVFAIYYSSMLSMESRRFTPKLIEAYQKLKKQYPSQFELIWVSCDRDEFNMGLHMRTLRMPWPASRHGAAREFFEPYAGGTMPWLVAVANTGQPLTENGKADHKEIDPNRIIDALEYLLAQVK